MKCEFNSTLLYYQRFFNKTIAVHLSNTKGTIEIFLHLFNIYSTLFKLSHAFYTVQCFRVFIIPHADNCAAAMCRHFTLERALHSATSIFLLEFRFALAFHNFCYSTTVDFLLKKGSNNAMHTCMILYGIHIILICINK